MTVTILLFAQAVVFAILSGIVASNKNRDPAGWGVIGFLFGLFGFIVAVAVGEVEEAQSSSPQKSESSSTQEFDPDEHQKKCPDCAEYIKLEAQVCRYCGHEYSDDEVEQQVEEIKTSAKKSAEKSTRKKEENYKSDDYDTDEILSTHEFNGIGICENCEYTRSYVKSNNYICPYR